MTRTTTAPWHIIVPAAVGVMLLGGAAGWYTGRARLQEQHQLELARACVVNHEADCATLRAICPEPDDVFEKLMKCEQKLPKWRGEAGAVVVGTPVIQGGLARENVRDVTQAQLGKVRECYAEALSRDTTTAGRMAIKFIVNLDGWVTMSAVDNSQLDAPQLEFCVARLARAWTFARLSRGSIAVVSLPFEFHPDPEHFPAPANLAIPPPRKPTLCDETKLAWPEVCPKGSSIVKRSSGFK